MVPRSEDGGGEGHRCSSTPSAVLYGIRPLRYSINVTLDGCCDHRVMFADEDLHRHAVENLDQADALLFGRVTYEMMELAFRPPVVFDFQTPEEAESLAVPTPVSYTHLTLPTSDL